MQLRLATLMSTAYVPAKICFILEFKKEDAEHSFAIRHISEYQVGCTTEKNELRRYKYKHYMAK